MKKMQRVLAVLLVCVMTALPIGAFPVSAAEQEVIYAENFDAAAVGEKPTTIGAVENTGKKLLARVEKEGDNSYVMLRCEEGGTAGAPRLQLSFDASKYSEVTLTYKAKAMDASAAVAFVSDGNAASTTLVGVNENQWTAVKVVMNFEKMTFSRWVGGEETATDRDFHTPSDASTSEFRFTSSLEPGQNICFDDIEIKGVVSDKPISKPIPIVTQVPFEPKNEPKAVRVPAGAHAFLNQDFTDAPLGTGTGSKIFDGGTAYSEIVDVGKNRLVRYWATDGKSHQPRLTLTLPENIDTFVIEYAYMMQDDSESYVSLYSDGKTNTSLAGSTVRNSAFNAGEWNYFHIELDLKNMTSVATLNGVEQSPRDINPIQNRGSVSIWFVAGIKPGEVVYMDNVCVYTQEEYKFTEIVKKGHEIVWENVKPSTPLSAQSYTNNLVAHPRIFVRDWDAMRAKVQASYEAKMWYANLKKEADLYLADKVSYVVNSRGNILESAREAEKRLQTLAFVYNIDGDKKYLDKAYAEMVEYGTWPDWSGEVSALVTAELIFGYACAYDWLYHDLTAEQRSALREIVKKHGLPIMIYTYEKKPNDSSFTSGTINWNPVCNTATIAAAYAFADEEPNLSEYILERAPGFIINALSPYAPQGAYPEGTTYWAYGTQFLCYAMDMLEYGFVDGFALPEKYKYYTYPGISETADFAIYYNGGAGKFDYGDSDSYLTSSAAFYWMANRFDKPQYAWYQNKLQRDKNAYMGALSAIFALSCYDAENAVVAPGAFTLDKFYSSDTEVSGMSMRSSWEGNRAVFAAMQGGNNAANHMHWSLGTYVIDYHNQRFVHEELTTDYALKNAAQEIYYKRAEAHNTLIANPTSAPDQSPSAVAKLIRSGTSDNTAFGILDMTQTNAVFADAKRGMMLTEHRNRVIVQDEVTAKEASEFYWFANTAANVKIAQDGKSALLEVGGEKMLARIIEGPADAKFDIMPTTSIVDGVVETQEGSKLTIHLKDVVELKLAVEYVGLEDGEGIPAPWACVPLANWSANDNGKTAVAHAGGATVLKLGSPNAIAKGEKTFVDTANCDVVPFTENGRTLVPVRFISESFGAKVGWDDATQTVSVSYLDKEIQLVIGSNEMKVNGETVILDVPANTYNSRTLIPLRALVEALGKHVFWDDRGLIIIADDDTPYSAEAIDKMIAELNVRVTANGKDIAFFEVDRENYVLEVGAGEAVPQIGAATVGGEVVAVTQAADINSAATVTIDGNVYTIRFATDAFAGVPGHKDSGVLSQLDVSMAGLNVPVYNTFIYVEDLTDSTNFASYPKRGIVDGVINTETKNRWACNGDGWIQMDFGSVKTVHSMAFAGVSQDARAYNFDVLASTDGVNYTTIHTGGAPTTMDKMSIIPLGDTSARYIKLVCHGSNQSSWNTYAEVRFYENAAQQAEDISYWPAYFADRSIHGKAGMSAKLVVEGMDAQRSAATIRPDASVSYKVANEDIATVSPDGTIQFLKAGATKVTVTVRQDGYTAIKTAAVTVE